MLWGELSKKIGAGWMIISAFCFALMGVFVKLGGQHFHFIELVFWRGVFGVVIMGVIAFARQEHFRTSLVKNHLLRSIAGVVSMFAYFYAMTKLPIATATTLNYTSPIFMVIVSYLFFQKKISKISFAGIIVGFSGVLLLLQPNFGNDAYKAVMVGLSSGLISSIAYIQIQQLTQLKEPEWRIVFYFSLVMCITCVLILTPMKAWHIPDWRSGFYLIGMGVCATIAQLTMTKAYSESNMFVVSAFSYTTIVFSTFFGVWLLHDVLHWLEFVSMVMIVASGFITKIGSAPRKKAVSSELMDKKIRQQ